MMRVLLLGFGFLLTLWLPASLAGAQTAKPASVSGDASDQASGQASERAPGMASDEAEEDGPRFVPTPQSRQAAATEPDGVPYEFETDGRIGVVTTVQGYRDRLAQFLEAQEFVDGEGVWIAGEDHLVLLGNLLGFGPQNIETLRFVKSLADQAEEAGGRVHVLIGNTDILNLRGLLSTLPASAYEHLATDQSQARLDERLARSLEELWDYNSDFPESDRLRLRENFERFYRRAHQPGAIEFMDLYASGTELGDWLRSSNAIVRINDLLFVSGGLHPVYADIPLARINAYYRDVINKDTVYVPAMTDLKAGPAVWTGLSFPQDENEPTVRDMNEVLAQREARMMVVGHSPSNFGETMLRGRVLHINNNFLAARDQAAYGGVVFTSPDRYLLINAGRERELRVPAAPEPTPNLEAAGG